MEQLVRDQYSMLEVTRTITLLTQIALADIRPWGEEGGAGEGEPLPDYCSDTASQQQYHSLLDHHTL